MYRLVDRRTVDDTRGLELDGTTGGRLNGAVAVDGLAQRVNDTPEHASTNRDVHDAARSAALVAFLDGVDVAEQHGAHLVGVEVLRKAVHVLSREGARELEELASHGALQALHVGDAIANLDDVRDLARVNGGRKVA